MDTNVSDHCDPTHYFIVEILHGVHKKSNGDHTVNLILNHIANYKIFN